MENSMQVPKKIKNRTAIWSNNSTSGYFSEENKNTNLKRHMFSYANCSNHIYIYTDTCIYICVYIYAAKSLQSCPTLCDPIDSSPLGSSVPGIFQARVLEWGAISFSNAWKWKVEVKLLSRARLLATPWTAVYQAPPSMGFSRQEYWSGVPLPSPCTILYTWS